MTKTVRVNVTTLANAAAVRREKRNGRDVVVVPSATLPDNVVMNGIMYPGDEIAKSFKLLEDTPAPLGHPKINGKFVSARNPEGINVGWIGAWNTNVRQENGRVLLDKVIDVEVANRSEGGKAVLAAIEAGGPIHTSTGLLCKLEAVNGEEHKHVARSIVWDHDAILLNEIGAATPDKGVGMLVNAEGQDEEIEVVNSSLTDDADREIDYAGARLVEALTRRENLGVWERMKTAILDAVRGSERETTLNNQENDMAVSEEQFSALSQKVNALSESMDKIGDTIGAAVTNAVKPLVDAQAEMVANQKAKDDAEKADLEAAVVKANVLDADTAKATPLATLRVLVANAKPKAAAPLNGAFHGNAKQGGFKLPAAEKE